VVLRDEREGRDRRHLSATLRDDGALVIEGQDLGPAVEAHFGPDNFEYEWVWTIEGDALARLRAALGTDDVLTALHARFSGDAAAGLSGYLTEHGVNYDAWSRVGD
jgi:hypothetical protein